jgi:hypothetical protein
MLKVLARTVPSGHLVVISIAPLPPLDLSGVPEMTPYVPSSRTPAGSEPFVTVNDCGTGMPNVFGAIVSVEPTDPATSVKRLPFGARQGLAEPKVKAPSEPLDPPAPPVLAAAADPGVLGAAGTEVTVVMGLVAPEGPAPGVMMNVTTVKSLSPVEVTVALTTDCSRATGVRGVPEITPVVEFRMSPAGRGRVSMKLSGRQPGGVKLGVRSGMGPPVTVVTVVFSEAGFEGSYDTEFVLP